MLRKEKETKMIYKCFGCGRLVDRKRLRKDKYKDLDEYEIKCPFCSSKILMKIRPDNVLKRVKAI